MCVFMKCFGDTSSSSECCEEAHRCLEGCRVRIECLLNLFCVSWSYVVTMAFPYGEASLAYHNCLCNVGNCDGFADE